MSKTGHSNRKQDIEVSKKKDRIKHETAFSQKSCVLFLLNSRITKFSTPTIVSKLGLRATTTGWPNYSLEAVLNPIFKMQPPDATTHQSSIVSLLPTNAKKVKQFSNVEIYQADMTHLKYADGRFDAVIAGNVIHLLDDPIAAVGELMRVCKPGGKVIIPTYTNIYNGKPSKLVKLFEKAGAHFKSQFDLYSYKAFFRNAGFENVDYHVVEGKMPCAVAVITKEHE